MFESVFGIDSDYVIIGLIVLVFILIILTIVNITKYAKLNKKYESFMSGKSAKSLEDTLIYRLQQVDDLIEANANNERNIDTLYKKAKFNFQKLGLIKYDALQEMGGKLSFCLCLLDERNCGYILNVVHSREGCYSYMKEIIDANSIVTLAEEEEQALDAALKGE